MPKFDLNYIKKDNKPLFANFEDINLMDVSKVQNYIPLYNKFFSINSTNYNNINLNHRFSIKSYLNSTIVLLSILSLFSALTSPFVLTTINANSLSLI